IVIRKAAMNVRIFLNPYALVTYAAAGAIIALARGKLRSQMTRLTAANPAWSRGLPAAGWGALAALIYNDSGTVAALFLIGAFLMTGVYLLFAGSPARA